MPESVTTMHTQLEPVTVEKPAKLYELCESENFAFQTKHPLWHELHTVEFKRDGKKVVSINANDGIESLDDALRLTKKIAGYGGLSRAVYVRHNRL